MENQQHNRYANLFFNFILTLNSIKEINTNPSVKVTRVCLAYSKKMIIVVIIESQSAWHLIVGHGERVVNFPAQCRHSQCSPARRPPS